MTRKLLLQKICPNAYINDCRFIGCSQCNEKLNEWLDEYDKQIRADVIEEFVKAIEEHQTRQDSYLDPPYVEMGLDMTDVLEVAEQLKEQKCYKEG